MPKIRTWDSGRIKKATAAPRSVSKAGKSSVNYAANRAKAAKAASGRTQDGGAEAAAAELMSGTVSDSAQRFVRKSGVLGYRAGKWGVRRFIQRRRTAKAPSTARQPQQPQQAPQIHPCSPAQKVPQPPSQSRSRSPALSHSVTKKSNITIRKDKPDIKLPELPVKRPLGKIRTASKVNTKAADATAKGAQAAAKKAAVKAASVKSARAAADRAKQAAVAAKEAGIKVAKALMEGARAAVRSLLLLVAGASVPILTALIMICAAASIVGSVFGIFFPSKGEWTLRSEVKEINQDYEDKIEDIKADKEHDRLHMIGTKATWPDVLAVYSVKMVNNPDDPEEVATMTRKKAKFLKKTFWEMNDVSSNTEKISESTVVNGKEQLNTYTVLNIETTHKTAWELADQLHFDDEQRQQLAELLDEKNQTLWNDILYGIGKGDKNIVSIALSQIGNVGGEPYWSWYGFQGRVPWCACFVSWCADQCGYIEDGIIPKFAGVGTAEDFYKKQGQWADRNYVPSPGDIIFFDWAENDGKPDGFVDHVGLVERVSDNIVYTIEGNSGDRCVGLHYAVGDYEIYGYGIPQYP